ncbi:hypothetical protein FUAX_26580 [Fulvitalea axinellae]|uniref:HU domain-containing protein n=1 Tax=Fulvitalea axinellae TaxID=1182444 RepID=A0AAU9DB20_9BACT|nr:hypothetical protein FUAX_26580 [Fulvitalea axinellae]
MAVKFKSIAKPIPGKPSAPKRHYAQAVSNRTINLRAFSAEIGRISTVSKPDIMAVLESFVELIPVHLKNGNAVNLGPLGTFYLNVKSEGRDKAEDVSSSSIIGNKLLFRPSKLIRTELKSIEYEKITPKPVEVPVEGVDA